MNKGAFPWQYSAKTNDWISANPILEMRTALDDALGVPTPAYSAGLAQGQPIKAIHIQELRDRVTAAWGSGSGGVDIRWLVTDHLGTPRMIIDKSGTLSGVSRHDYLPFGEELFANAGGRTTGYTNNDGARQKFTSKQRDNETGLDWFDSRYYSSVQGRFTSPDSYGGRLVNPQTLNLYSYVRNNPLKYADPSGHQDELPTKKGKKGNHDDEFINTEDTPEVIVLPAGTCNCGTPKPPPTQQPTGWDAFNQRIWHINNTLFRFQLMPASTTVRLIGGQRALDEFHHTMMALGPLAIEAQGEIEAERVEAALEGELDVLMEEGLTFDQARVQAFEEANMTDASTVKFTKVDPDTGTVVEFKGEGGAKVAYDGPHSQPGPSHDVPHVGWQSGGKRAAGAQRGNIPYTGSQHPSRSPIKGRGVVDPH